MNRQQNRNGIDQTIQPDHPRGSVENRKTRKTSDFNSDLINKNRIYFFFPDSILFTVCHTQKPYIEREYRKGAEDFLLDSKRTKDIKCWQ